MKKRTARNKPSSWIRQTSRIVITCRAKDERDTISRRSAQHNSFASGGPTNFTGIIVATTCRWRKTNTSYREVETKEVDFCFSGDGSVKICTIFCSSRLLLRKLLFFFQSAILEPLLSAESWIICCTCDVPSLTHYENTVAIRGPIRVPTPELLIVVAVDIERTTASEKNIINNNLHETFLSKSSKFWNSRLQPHLWPSKILKTLETAGVRKILRSQTTFIRPRNSRDVWCSVLTGRNLVQVSRFRDGDSLQILSIRSLMRSLQYRTSVWNPSLASLISIL